jgi:Uma2 family endonuclease
MALRANVPKIEKTYTVEEFENSPEFQENYELVNGKLVKRPLIGDQHGRIARRLNNKIFLHDPDEKLGLLWFNTNFDVGTGWVPCPDLGFIVAERVPAEGDKSVKVVPDLVVEIHLPSDLRSKATRLATAKKIKDWQDVGVQIVWAINPPQRQVEVYHQGQDAPVQVLTENDILDGEEIIPNFKMPVKDLF